MSKARSIPLDWLACPVTKAPLILAKGALVSPTGATYVRGSGGDFWDFLPRHQEMDRPEWKAWNVLQANGVVSYQADPEHNLGVGERSDFRQFAEFCDFHGNVLDIGVGPQRCPTHIQHCSRTEVFFVGLDPLVGDQPRCFAFVRGLGEYLPFRRSVFDQVLFVTSLDHFIDPRPPLREAARALREDGDICVWIGEKDRNAPRPKKTNPWYETLKVPPGAEDRFHFKRFTTEEFEGYLSELRFVIVGRRVLEIDQWRRNLFYRIRPSQASDA